MTLYEPTDFDSFYNNELLPVMKELIVEDKASSKWGYAGVAAFFIGAALFFGYNTKDVPGFVSGWGIAGCIVMFIISIYKYTQRNDRFDDTFKDVMIRKIVQHINPDTIYYPEKRISRNEYKISSLFRKYYDYFEGSDYMSNTYKNVSFHCSQITTQFDSGNRQITIFSGLFFIASISDDYSGGTYVWARNAEQLPVSMADEAYRLMPMGPVSDIKFNDAAFEEKFRVCTNSTRQAAAWKNRSN